MCQLTSAETVGHLKDAITIAHARRTASLTSFSCAVIVNLACGEWGNTEREVHREIVLTQHEWKQANVAHNVWSGGKPGGHNRQQLGSHVLAGCDGLLTHAHIAPRRLHRQALCCIASAPFLYTRCSFSVKRPSMHCHQELEHLQYCSCQKCCTVQESH